MTFEDRSRLAEAHLLVRVACSPDASWHEQAERSGALDAAAAVGLVSPARVGELAALAGRLAAGAAPPAVDSSARARVLERLERLVPLAERGLVRGGEDDAEWRAYLEFDASVHALHALGALTDAELEGWFERIGIAPLDPSKAERPEPLLALRAVLPGSLVWRDGVRLHAVECYDGGVAVRWERRRGGRPGSPADGESDALPSLADDVGTDYRYDGGGGGSAEVREDHWIDEFGDQFTPAVPLAARTLTLHLGTARFELDVTGVGEREAV